MVTSWLSVELKVGDRDIGNRIRYANEWVVKANKANAQEYEDNFVIKIWQILLYHPMLILTLLKI